MRARERPCQAEPVYDRRNLAADCGSILLLAVQMPVIQEFVVETPAAGLVFD